MPSARLLAPVLAIVTATACNSIHSSPPAQPAPAQAEYAQRGHGRGHGSSSASTLGIPPGHLPPPGLCRVWLPGTPPGHQPKARSCNLIERTAPAGSLIVYRPTEDRKVVHVRVVDERRPGVVIHLRVYDIERGVLIRES